MNRVWLVAGARVSEGSCRTAWVLRAQAGMPALKPWDGVLFLIGNGIQDSVVAVLVVPDCMVVIFPVQLNDAADS